MPSTGLLRPCSPASRSTRVHGHPGLSLANALARAGGWRLRCSSSRPDARGHCSHGEGTRTLTSWLQTRVTLVDRGRCGWSLDGGGPFKALPGMQVAAPVAAYDPSLVRRAHTFREWPPTALCAARSPPSGRLQSRWCCLAGRCAPSAFRFSGGCAGPGKSTSAACAASMPLRSVRESRIVAVFPEPFVSTLLVPGVPTGTPCAG